MLLALIWLYSIVPTGQGQSPQSLLLGSGRHLKDNATAQAFTRSGGTLNQAWSQDEVNHDGEIHQFSGLTTDPVLPYQQKW